jgi:hypothetical protein
MNATLTYSPEAVTALKSIATGSLQLSLRRVQTSFAATPDDKLGFKPSETANSPLQIIQHLIVGNDFVSGTLGFEHAVKEPSSDRAELVLQLVETTEAIISSIQNLSDEQVNGSVDFFGHPMPMANFMMVNEWHFTRHIGQLEYIQTIYGDMENYL